jgi:hypothetical protein
MAVAINATWQHQCSGGIHQLCAISEAFGHCDNAAILDANIAACGSEAGRDFSAAYYQIKFSHDRPLSVT